MSELENNMLLTKDQAAAGEHLLQGLFIDVPARGPVESVRARPAKPIVEKDSSGHVTKVARPDGSSDRFEYEGDRLSRFVRRSRAGELTVWERKSEPDKKDLASVQAPSGQPPADRAHDLVRWVSTQAPDDMLINLRVEKSGKVIWEEVLGAVVNKLPDGSTSRDNVNGSHVLLDSNARIRCLQKSDGERIEAVWKNGIPVKYTVEKGSEASVWLLSGKNQWSLFGSQEIRRFYNLSDTGIESYVSSKHGLVNQIEYPDGASRTFVHEGGRLTKVREHSLAQHSDTVWTRIGDSDMWKSAGLAEKRMVVNVNPNGDYSFTDSKGRKHTYRLDESEEISCPGPQQCSKEVQAAASELSEKAKICINDGERRGNFLSDLNRFEEQAQLRGVDDAKIAQSLHELSALLSCRQNSYLKADARVALGEQLLHNLAYPRATDQGSHDTCGATAAEVVLSARHPDRLANLLRQIADTGEYTTALGLVVRPSAQSLIPDSEAGGFDPYDADSDGVRSFAAQLIQTVGIDSIYAASNHNQLYESRDSQEYVVNRDTGEKTSFKGLEDPEVEEMLRQISGVELKAYSKDKQFNSPDSLRKVLQKLETAGAFPVVFSVDMLKDGPFLEQYHEDRAGLDYGGHYVTIWDIDSKNNVMIDDQFGRENDFESLRRVPVESLFQSAIQVRRAPLPRDRFHIPHPRRTIVPRELADMGKEMSLCVEVLIGPSVCRQDDIR
jgi:hypothetical protein